MSVQWPLVKVVFLGPSYAGKTALVNHIHQGTFQAPQSAGGITEDILKSGSRNYRLQVIGFVRLETIMRRYSREADVIVFMFDVTDRNSLHTMRAWYADNTDAVAAPVILLGNKNDTQRTVSTEEGLQFAREIGAVFVEISAKRKSDVDVVVQLVKVLAKADTRTKLQTATTAKEGVLKKTRS